MEHATSPLPSSPGAVPHKPEGTTIPLPGSPMAAQLRWLWQAQGRLAPQLRRVWWGLALGQAAQHAFSFWLWCMCVLVGALVAAACAAWVGSVVAALAGTGGALVGGRALGPKLWRAERVRLAGFVERTAKLLDGVPVEDARSQETPRASRFPGLFPVAVLVCVVTTAMIAVPNFMSFGCRSKGAEANSRLRAVLSGETAFHQTHGRYALLPELLEKGVVDPSIATGHWYQVSISLGGSGFVARAEDSLRAIAPRATAPDVWEVAETDAKPRHLHDACVQ